MPYNPQGYYESPSTATKLALGGAGGIAGMFPAPGQQATGTQQSQQNTVNSSSFDQNTLSQLESFLRTLSSLQNESRSTSTTAPTLGGPQQALIDQITQKYSSMTPVDLRPYEAGQINQINRNSGIQSQAVNNIMAARGLSTSPVAGTADANIENNRIGRISDFQSQLPLLQRDLELKNLTSAGGFLSSIPRGQTQTQTGFGTQTGTTEQTGRTFNEGSVAGRNAGTSEVSGTQTSQQQTKPTGSGGIGGFLQGLVSVLLSLFA